MKTEQLMNAMNGLPEELVWEARPTARVMPRRRILRTALIAAVLAMLMTVTAYAAGGSLAGQRSSPRPGARWTSLEKLPKAEKRLGVDVIVPEGFSNGYAFKRMELLYTEVTDEAGQVTETWPELDVRYEDGQGGTVHIDIMADRPQIHNGPWRTREVDGVTLWYESFTYMGVPERYRPTDDERAQVESGELMIGYGADEVELHSSSFAQFTMDGVLYNLLNMDGLPVEELTAMAEEIIQAR